MKYIDMIDQAYYSDGMICVFIGEGQCTLITKDLMDNNNGWLWKLEEDPLLHDCSVYDDGVVVHGNILHDEDDEFFDPISESYRKELLMKYKII